MLRTIASRSPQSGTCPSWSSSDIEILGEISTVQGSFSQTQVVTLFSERFPTALSNSTYYLSANPQTPIPDGPNTVQNVLDAMAQVDASYSLAQTYPNCVNLTVASTPAPASIAGGSDTPIINAAVQAETSALSSLTPFAQLPVGCPSWIGTSSQAANIDQLVASCSSKMGVQLFSTQFASYFNSSNPLNTTLYSQFVANPSLFSGMDAITLSSNIDGMKRAVVLRNITVADRFCYLAPTTNAPTQDPFGPPPTTPIDSDLAIIMNLSLSYGGLAPASSSNASCPSWTKTEDAVNIQVNATMNSLNVSYAVSIFARDFGNRFPNGFNASYYTWYYKTYTVRPTTAPPQTLPGGTSVTPPTDTTYSDMMQKKDLILRLVAVRILKAQVGDCVNTAEDATKTNTTSSDATDLLVMVLILNQNGTVSLLSPAGKNCPAWAASETSFDTYVAGVENVTLVSVAVANFSLAFGNMFSGGFNSSHYSSYFAAQSWLIGPGNASLAGDVSGSAETGTSDVPSSMSSNVPSSVSSNVPSSMSSDVPSSMSSDVPSSMSSDLSSNVPSSSPGTSDSNPFSSLSEGEIMSMARSIIVKVAVAQQLLRQFPQCVQVGAVPSTPPGTDGWLDELQRMLPTISGTYQNQTGTVIVPLGANCPSYFASTSSLNTEFAREMSALDPSTAVRQYASAEGYRFSAPGFNATLFLTAVVQLNLTAANTASVVPTTSASADIETTMFAMTVAEMKATVINVSWATQYPACYRLNNGSQPPTTNAPTTKGSSTTVAPGTTLAPVTSNTVTTTRGPTATSSPTSTSTSGPSNQTSTPTTVTPTTVSNQTTSTPTTIATGTTKPPQTSTSAPPTNQNTTTSPSTPQPPPATSGTNGTTTSAPTTTATPATPSPTTAAPPTVFTAVVQNGTVNQTKLTQQIAALAGVPPSDVSLTVTTLANGSSAVVFSFNTSSAGLEAQAAAKVKNSDAAAWTAMGLNAPQSSAPDTSPSTSDDNMKLKVGIVVGVVVVAAVAIGVVLKMRANKAAQGTGFGSENGVLQDPTAHRFNSDYEMYSPTNERAAVI